MARETSSMERDSFEGRDEGGRCLLVDHYVLFVVLDQRPSSFTLTRWRGWSHNPGVPMVAMCQLVGKEDVDGLWNPTYIR